MNDDIPLELIPPVEMFKLAGPFFDRSVFLANGQHVFSNLRNFGFLKPTHSVLDVGCGVGRIAIHLTQYLAPGSSYFGLDAGSRQIDWCTNAIASRYPNFRFRHLDAHNACYNPRGKMPASDVKFPIPDGAVDFCFLISVFTHMLPNDVRAYLSEIHRCLKPGGILYCTFFLINEDSLRDIRENRGEFRFASTGKGYFTNNAALPEAAVAYEESDVRSMLSQSGFRLDKILYGGWSGKIPSSTGQDNLVSFKR